MQNVEILTTSGVSHSLSRDAGELKFDYRFSPFQKMSDFSVIVAATFDLQPNSDAKQRQRIYLERCEFLEPFYSPYSMLPAFDFSYFSNVTLVTELMHINAGSHLSV